MKSSNATASFFGYDFQSNAAIMLMLKNIESASKVKVEGDTEDIEIYLSTGKRLMSQAKSVEKQDDYKNVIANLGNGLRTLENAAKCADVEQLVFVTNSPNPFNDVHTMYKFSSPLNLVPFSELPDISQKLILDICEKRGYELNTNSLTICVMQFHGEDLSERYKVLSELTSDFLNTIGATKISRSDLLTLWQHSFAVNASQRTASITKGNMVWPIIAIMCEVGKNDSELEDFDEHDVEEVLQRYKGVINNYSERFEFVTRIISDYSDFHPEKKSKERRRLFVDEKWSDYKDYVDIKTAPDETIELIIRLTLSKVLLNRQIITDIKGKVKL